MRQEYGERLGSGETGEDVDPGRARSAARAGAFAFYVDQFDIYLPVLVLAPVAGYFQPAGTGAGTAAVLAAMVFASTLITRPIGAAVFGHLADTWSRKTATLVAVAGFGIVTLLIAAVPGERTVGLWSITLLIALRAVNGVFLGGEYTTAVPLAMEWTPRRRRGPVGGAILAASPVAYATLGAVTAVLVSVLPSAGPDSAYAQWGWRIPFVVGAVLAGVLFLYYRRAVEEPPTERTSATGRSPLVELLVGPHRRRLARAFVLMTGVWLANNMTSAVLPGLLRNHVGLSARQVSVTMVVEALVLSASLPLYGLLSQRVGRRAFYLTYGAVIVLLGAPLYAVVMTTTLPFPLLVLITALVGVATLGTLGPVIAYLTELFPSTMRATGFGVSYSLALVLPGFYAFYLDGLSVLAPSHLAPLVLLGLAGLLVSLGGYLGPETRDAVVGAPQVRGDDGVPGR